MDFKLIWTFRARADLEEIVRFIAKEKPRAAIQLGEDLFRHVKVLETFPMIGPAVRPSLGADTWRIVCGDYLIIYRFKPTAKEVEIVSIWHAARSQPDFL